jgi:hypothetical protein
VSLVVLLILAAVWAVFLVPQVVRARADKTPSDSVGAFRRQLSVLERTSPVVSGHLGRPMSSTQVSRSRAIKRRRDVLGLLLVAMLATLVLSMLPWFGALLTVHFALDALFVVYVGLLFRARSISNERQAKVHYLPERNVPEPVFALQRYSG